MTPKEENGGEKKRQLEWGSPAPTDSTQKPNLLNKNKYN